MLTKEWTGDLVGLMHNHKITFAQLARKLGVTNRYVSMVINGHRDPACAKERFLAAAKELIAENEVAERNDTIRNHEAGSRGNCQQDGPLYPAVSDGFPDAQCAEDL